MLLKEKSTRNKSKRSSLFPPRRPIFFFFFCPPRRPFFYFRLGTARRTFGPSPPPSTELIPRSIALLQQNFSCSPFSPRRRNLCASMMTLLSGGKKVAPPPPLQREEEKMLAAIYRRGGMEEEEFSVYMPSMFVPPPSLPQTIKNSFGWSAGRSIISRLAPTPMSFGEGEGNGHFWKRCRFRLASPPIAPYSHRLSRKKGEK